MKILDLTHTITNNMTVFPGSQQPNNIVINSVDTDGWMETRLYINSHDGTHVDSPAHVLENGITLDKVDVYNFIGMAALIDCTSINEGGEIGYEFIENNKNIIDNAEFIIFRTDWSKYWNSDRYFYKYPVISEKVVDFIISSNKKGVAFDTISVDPIDSTILPNHQKLLANDILIFENLTNLNLIQANLFLFCALPLKFENSDGAPIRAIAMID